MKEDNKKAEYSEGEDLFGDYVTHENESEYSTSDIPVSNHSKKINISKAFAGSLSNKLKILAEAIEEIDQLIKLRKSLSKIIQERIDKEIFDSECLLLQVKPWQLGHSNSVEMRRLGLEREILSLNKEKRGEEVRAWEHVSSLMKLKRQFLIEYQNLLNTKETLEGSAP
jgi:hypothetical protein